LTATLSLQATSDADEQSPVRLVPRSKIKPLTEILLAVRSGGRCQFCGCNEEIYRSALTGETGNFADKAHIVAFRKDGPRGDEDRPENIDDIENLMLLCLRDHRLIDRNPARYTREVLQQYKREHEARITYATGLGPEMQTTVLQFTARIGQFAPAIARAEIIDALLPKYPAADPFMIDLNGVGAEAGSDYYAVAARRITQRVSELVETGGPLERTRRLSIFGLGPIPLLVVLGHAVGNKIETQFFQCHRDNPGRRWCWQDDGGHVQFELHQLANAGNVTDLGLILSLSGPVSHESLPALAAGQPLFEIRPSSHQPNTALIRQRGDLEAFRAAYRRAIAELRGRYPALKRIHLFPAVPAPVAVACGFDLLPKVDPELAIYDNVKEEGGFVKRLSVNEHER
jgi:SMODS-associated and fused to various effectors sensor domain